MTKYTFFENKEIIILYDDFKEKQYILNKLNNTFFIYNCNEYYSDYEDLEKGFYIELEKHNISNETIEEIRKEFTE